MDLSPTKSRFWGVAPYERSTRAEVVDKQRRRLMLGMTRVIARKGYPDTTVADVLAEVRISRRTFYELFKDKEDCFLAVYDTVHHALVEAVKDSQRGIADPVERIECSHRAYLEFFRDEPEVGATMLRGIRGTGRRIDERCEQAHYRFAQMHTALQRQCRRAHPRLPRVPTVAFRGLVEGTNSIVEQQVSADHAASIMELLPAILYLAYSVYGFAELALEAITEPNV